MTRLTNSDITLLKKMYCDQTGNNLVTSPSWGQGNYPDNLNKVYPIKVEAGSVIEILLTDFMLEAHESCSYDWVKIVDGDGTELLGKVTFFYPMKSSQCFSFRLVEQINLLLPSRAKRMRQKLNFIPTHLLMTRLVTFVIFLSLKPHHPQGFRAEWKAVKATVPVAGGWGNWGAWSSCANNQ